MKQPLLHAHAVPGTPLLRVFLCSSNGGPLLQGKESLSRDPEALKLIARALPLPLSLERAPRAEGKHPTHHHPSDHRASASDTAVTTKLTQPSSKLDPFLARSFAWPVHSHSVSRLSSSILSSKPRSLLDTRLRVHHRRITHNSTLLRLDRLVRLPSYRLVHEADRPPHPPSLSPADVSPSSINRHLISHTYHHQNTHRHPSSISTLLSPSPKHRIPYARPSARASTLDSLALSLSCITTLTHVYNP
ncbi:hypothetical protein A1Q2_00917 [Trichosporon asahii var. asahii CBS 8904]|uniref:Uncharacterized protein n=1 Tax=Trichosporon asahii var. asahii (strain CBS 8904) TaxID=1220162 RepID=K1VW64_TRIAC|nr:hypothetical protein A1Q2_00917 [Trichosporon asahii var. asahii CBS 8904]